MNVVVIGAGAIGLCAAYYLNGRGAKVTVLDKAEIGSGSSLHNAGLLCPSHFIPLASPGIIAKGLKWMLTPTSPFYIKPRLDMDLFSWGWQLWKHSTESHVRRTMRLLRDLNELSLQLFAEIAAEPGMDFGLTRKGLLILYRTEGGKKGCEHEAELAADIGMEARLVNGDGLREIEPHMKLKARGGLYFPGDAHLSPATFLRQFTDLLTQKGVDIRAGTEALRFETRNGRVTGLITHDGKFEADVFVLAAGSWSPGVLKPLGIRMLMQPGKGYSVTVPAPSPSPNIPYILAEARVAVTPMLDGLRIAGTMEIAGMDLSVTKRRVEAILNAVSRYVEGVDTSRIDRSAAWAGLRPVTPDGMPYIGRWSTYSNLIAATGHAMIGITMATATGKLVAQLGLGERPDIDVTLLHPERFN